MAQQTTCNSNYSITVYVKPAMERLEELIQENRRVCLHICAVWPLDAQPDGVGAHLKQGQVAVAPAPRALPGPAVLGVQPLDRFNTPPGQAGAAGGAAPADALQRVAVLVRPGQPGQLCFPARMTVNLEPDKSGLMSIPHDSWR